jgi:hypothetical protein
VAVKLPSAARVPITPTPQLRAGRAWEWLGICVVLRVVAPADRPDVKAVLKATEPPLLAVPLTIRSALSLCVVLLVQLVGEAVCTNSITVPEGMSAVLCPVPP